MRAVSTHQALAGSIGHSDALQAVGSAIGSNHLAYLIPCHRIIKKNLLVGEYDWGAERKKAILGWEMTKTEGDPPPGK